jgi:hypothetical protein
MKVAVFDEDTFELALTLVGMSPGNVSEGW